MPLLGDFAKQVFLFLPLDLLDDFVLGVRIEVNEFLEEGFNPLLKFDTHGHLFDIDGKTLYLPGNNSLHLFVDFIYYSFLFVFLLLALLSLNLLPLDFLPIFVDYLQLILHILQSLLCLFVCIGQLPQVFVLLYQLSLHVVNFAFSFEFVLFVLPQYNF